MKCREIYEALDRQIPFSYQMDWDNSGFLIGRGDKEIRNILTALDLTDAVLDSALEMNADLIVTHHPMIWDPIKSVTDKDPVGRRVLRLAENGICYIASHTCYDAAPGGMADICADMIGLKGTPLIPVGEKDGKAFGIGKTGTLERPMELDEIVKLVKEAFALDTVTVYGSEIWDGPTDRAAMCPGSGRGEYPSAAASGARVFITGDYTHHEGLDAVMAGLTVIDAGHFGLEKVFIRDMSRRLAAICGEETGIGITYETYGGRLM